MLETPNLGLKKWEAGDNVQTWHDAVNENMDAIDNSLNETAQDVNDVKQNMSLLEGGTQKVEAVPAGQVMSVEIPFVKNYKYAPLCFLTILSGAPQLYSAGVSATTTTFFRVYVHNRHTAPIDISFNWLALNVD